MARIFAVIGALARVVLREQRRLNGIAANNILWILILLGQGGAGAFVFLLVGVVALFPLAGDPFRKLPAERAASWPVSGREHRIIRIAAVFLSPAAWIAIAMIVWTRRPQFLLVAFALVMLAVPFPQGRFFRGVPGWFGELARKNVRELLCLLDTWIAALLALATIAYRFAARQQPPEEAWLVMSMLIVVTMSTAAQCLFALDAGPGIERYQLMPIRGWRVLVAKHAALLAVLMLFTLPLAPLPALSATLTAMAVGNHMAVLAPRRQPPWSLTAGSMIPGLFQAGLAVAAGIHTARDTPFPVLAGCAILYVVSTAFYGWRFDRNR